MITNVNIRILGNKHVFVQYQRDGKAYDAGFKDWQEFIEWLKEQTNLN